MKKILLLVTAFLSLTVPAYAANFPDVAEGHKNYKAIEYLKSKDIIHGYQDGTFGPDDTLNRAQAMTIISTAFNVAHDGQYDVLFPDVKNQDWFFPFVMGAQKAGIAHGYPDGTFKPERSVNLAEALKLMIQSSKVVIPTVPDTIIFEDVPTGTWYSSEAYYAREHFIILADDYAKIYPDKEMKRADFCEIVYRMLIVLENQEKPFPIQDNWPAYDSPILPYKMKYPSNWQIIKSSKDETFFKLDGMYGQFSPTRLYPNSAKVNLTFDLNPDKLSSADYFENIKSVFTGASYKNFTLSGLSSFEVLYPEKRSVDWYIYTPNQTVLAVYTEYGDGVLGFQLTKLIKTMLSTLEYKELVGGVTDYSQIMSQIFANVLVKNKGMEMLNLLSDKIIIETDAIGVGTGPIDYYYSEGADYTLKYERSNDTILATKKGKTSAF